MEVRIKVGKLRFVDRLNDFWIKEIVLRHAKAIDKLIPLMTLIGVTADNDYREYTYSFSKRKFKKELDDLADEGGPNHDGSIQYFTEHDSIWLSADQEEWQKIRDEYQKFLDASA